MNSLDHYSKSYLIILLLFLSINSFAEGNYNLSYIAVNLSNNEVIEEHNSNLLSTPASLQKLITTATWIESCDTNSVYKTSFFSDGDIKNGVLNGNVIIKAGNDITLGSKYFDDTNSEKVLNFLKNSFNQKGVFSINGKIIVDLSILPPPYQPAGRIIEDIGNYYAATPQGLNWKDNSVDIVLKSSNKVGGLVEIIDHNPKLSGYQVNSYLLSANNSKDSAYVYGNYATQSIDIRGSIPKGRNAFVIRAANPQPHISFINDFTALFEDSNFSVEYLYEQISTTNLEKMCDITSPSSFEIIKVINQQSNNLFADNVYLSLPVVANPWERWHKSSLFVKSFWQNKEISSSAIIYDGSGLSPNNKLSTKYIVDILKHMYYSENYEFFKNTLAQSGISGTLRRWQNREVHGLIYAKSGSMQGVLGYAGYLYSKKGDIIAFAVIANNFNHKKDILESEIQNIVNRWVLN